MQSTAHIGTYEKKTPVNSDRISRFWRTLALLALVISSLWGDMALDQARAVSGINTGDNTHYLFGTLLADSEKATQSYSAGVRLVELELGWNLYEPDDGVFSASYAAAVQHSLRQFQSAGLKVVLGIGLQYPPTWLHTYPNSSYVNQYGTQAPGYVNLTFNRTMRSKAEEYIARVDREIGLNNFWAVRIGSGSLIEVLYPEETAGGNTNAYWAYDANAQANDEGRPTSIPAVPYAGWRPGQKTYNGQPFTPAQVKEWYKWYLDALVDGVNWQITVYKRLGFIGYEHVILPGLGSRPEEYTEAIADRLGGFGDDNRTMGRGAVWHKVISGLKVTGTVVIDISSVGDRSSVSATSHDDLCRAHDFFVGLDDPQINRWSSTRWISYNAHRNGLPIIGENPALADAGGLPYDPAMMRHIAELMRSCGLHGLLWAHEWNLYDSASNVGIDDYATVIKEYSR